LFLKTPGWISKRKSLLILYDPIAGSTLLIYDTSPSSYVKQMKVLFELLFVCVPEENTSNIEKTTPKK